MTKKCDKHKMVNNFTTMSFIKNWFPHKGRLVHLGHLCRSRFFINLEFEELFEKLHLLMEGCDACMVDLLEILSSDGMA